MEIFEDFDSADPDEVQTVWIQIRAHIQSVLIWLQTVCKGYQQMIKVTASKEIVRDRKYITLIFQRKIAIIFLSTSLNMCFGCSKEPSQ